MIDKYGVKLQVQINDNTKKMTASSIFGGTIEKISKHYNGQLLKQAVDAGHEAAKKFSQVAESAYWDYSHEWDTGNLRKSWVVSKSGNLQWIITNQATNPANAAIEGRSVNYIIDLETIWDKPFVEKANEDFDRVATEIFNKELAKL